MTFNMHSNMHYHHHQHLFCFPLKEPTSYSTVWCHTWGLTLCFNGLVEIPQIYPSSAANIWWTTPVMQLGAAQPNILWVKWQEDVSGAALCVRRAMFAAFSRKGWFDKLPENTASLLRSRASLRLIISFATSAFSASFSATKPDSPSLPPSPPQKPQLHRVSAD